MTEEEARQFLDSQYFKDYCVNAGYMQRLMDKYNGNKSKSRHELKRLEKWWDKANRVLYPDHPRFKNDAKTS